MLIVASKPTFSTTASAKPSFLVPKVDLPTVYPNTSCMFVPLKNAIICSLLGVFSLVFKFGPLAGLTSFLIKPCSCNFLTSFTDVILLESTNIFLPFGTLLSICTHLSAFNVLCSVGMYFLKNLL